MLKLVSSVFVLMTISVAVDCGAAPPITSVVFAPDGSSVVACSQAGVTVYGWPDLKPLTTIQTSSPNLHELAFAPGGDRLAVAGGTPAEDGTVEILSWPDGKSLRVLNGHFDSVMAVDWLDETTLVSASLDHQILLWDTSTGEKSVTLKGHSRGVWAIGHLHDPRLLVSAGGDQSLRVWEIETGTLIRSMAIHLQPVGSVAVRPPREGLPMIASASDDQTVRFWQPTIGRMVRFARLPSQPRQIRWVRDGSRIAACCNDGRVYLVNPETVEVSDGIPAIEGRAYTIAVDPSGGNAVVGGSDGALQRIALP
ncbi:WD40 repeat domain-containing protein [Stieleria sp. ICT_E10.1]|uniref:WD40 repeat domain-containing protein n=1 Tax=Stieleria sedimenti TaxID=2976331 RepID=UPI00217F7E4D|nr:WD40 repeat domain-containing protein [Stieleria sedimenti]MCS7470668.1 WD40 repeat domain-containing protein [Stieleria sedimenti]